MDNDDSEFSLMMFDDDMPLIKFDDIHFDFEMPVIEFDVGDLILFDGIGECKMDVEKRLERLEQSLVETKDAVVEIKDSLSKLYRFVQMMLDAEKMDTVDTVRQADPD